MKDMATFIGALAFATLGAIGLAMSLGARLNWAALSVAIPVTLLVIGVASLAWRYRRHPHQPQEKEKGNHHV